MQHQQAYTDVNKSLAMDTASEQKTVQPSSGVTLSEDDVLRLLNDPSPQARVDITGKLAFSYSNTQMNDTETVVAEQIFRLLMRDMEVRVRSCLAQNIKSSTSIPKDIVMTLARDVEEVSLPVLQYSEVLDDSDLVELIHSTKEISRHLAMSMRSKVSAEVSETLLDTGSDKVAFALVNNTGAAISENGLQKIIETFPENESLLKALSDRPALPAASVEKLINVVSSSLSEELKKKYQKDNAPAAEAEIDQEIEKVKDAETLNLVDSGWSQEEVEKLITQLMAFDRLSPSIILRALCQGNFNFFETSLARLSNVPLANARKLINDKGELGFRAVYNKSGLPDTMFPAVRLLNKVVHELRDEGEDPASKQFSNRIVERILHYSEDDPVDNLSYIIALIRRVSQ